jgi:hypothetical protein
LVQVDDNYSEHCMRARQIAEQYFDATTVLRDVVTQCGLVGG